MDYRNLLIRYLSLVLETQGVTYVDATGASVKLTAEERVELAELEKAARVALRR